MNYLLSALCVAFAVAASSYSMQNSLEKYRHHEDEVTAHYQPFLQDQCQNQASNLAMEITAPIAVLAYTIKTKAAQIHQEEWLKQLLLIFKQRLVCRLKELCKHRLDTEDLETACNSALSRTFIHEGLRAYVAAHPEPKSIKTDTTAGFLLYLLLHDTTFLKIITKLYKTDTGPCADKIMLKVFFKAYVDPKYVVLRKRLETELQMRSIAHLNVPFGLYKRTAEVPVLTAATEVVRLVNALHIRNCINAVPGADITHYKTYLATLSDQELYRVRKELEGADTTLVVFMATVLPYLALEQQKLVWQVLDAHVPEQIQDMINVLTQYLKATQL